MGTGFPKLPEFAGICRLVYRNGGVLYPFYILSISAVYALYKHGLMTVYAVYMENEKVMRGTRLVGESFNCLIG